MDPAKGRFRAFVRACLDNFLLDEFDKRKAAKRRAQFEFREATEAAGTGRDFERDWALAVLERACVALREQAPREAEIGGAVATVPLFNPAK